MPRDLFVKIYKTGNSLVIPIPASVCRELILKRGDYLGLAVENIDTITLKRLKVVASDTLEERRDATLPLIKNGQSNTKD